MTENNGHQPEPNGAAPLHRIPFGDLPTQDLHPDIAAAMLRQLFENEPGTWARLHLAALTGGDKYTVTVRSRDAAEKKSAKS